MIIKKVAIIISFTLIASCDDVENLQRLQDANKKLQESIQKISQEKNKISGELREKIKALEGSQAMLNEITLQKTEIEKKLTVTLADKDQLKKDVEEYKRKAEARQKLLER
jgi:Skp family chaperone for outer membrane proteins